MAQDVNVRNWEDMESVLFKSFTRAFKEKGDKEEGSFSQQTFTSTLEQHKAALVENTKNIENLTRAIQSLSGGIGGSTGGSGGFAPPNVRTPQDGETGKSASGGIVQKALGNMGLRRGESILAGSEDNPIFDFLARSMIFRGGLNSAAAIGSQISPANIGRNFYAGAQKFVEPYVTQPTELGMAAGYQGPGYEPFSQAGSSFGSLVAGRFGFASNILTGGSNPNLIGGAFGAGMSEAQSQGLRTQYRAFTKSLNPFDMLSYGKAMEINQAVASKGFKTLDQQVSVEDALTDIVQKTGIDAGAALDTLDLSVKRLGTDIKDAADILKEYGPLAKAAGKSVTEFAQESNQVLNQISAVGAKGSGAQLASIGYSSFSQVEGSAVSQFLNSPELSGLMAASMMSGGPGSQFGNPQDMLTLAQGFGPAMGGGGKADEVFIAQVQNVQKQITTLQKQTGLSRPMAQQMFAGMTRKDPLLIAQIDNEGKKVIESMKVTGELADFTKDYRDFRQGKPLRGALATRTDEGKAAFKSLQDMHRSGGGVSVSGIAGNVMTGGLHGILTGDYGIAGGGIDFDKLDIGGKDPAFEENVKELYEARMRGDEEKVKEITKRMEDDGLDVDEIGRAASLLMQAGSGDEGSWKKLSQDFGIRIKGENGDWVSDQGRVPKEIRQKAISEMRDFTQDFFERGVINEKQKSSLLKKINSKESLSPEKFQSEVQKMITRKRQQENEIKISLTADAKKYFNISKAGSAQSKIVTVAPPGQENRAVPFPWMNGG